MTEIEMLERYMTQDKELLLKTDFVVSWHAKKYNKFIWGVGNMNKEG